MKSTIIEKYFSADDSLAERKFIEEYWGELPQHPMYWHIACLDNLQMDTIVYCKGSSEDFRESIAFNLNSKIAKIQYPDKDAISFILATHGIKGFDPNGLLYKLPAMSYLHRKIANRTNGYLIYKSQAVELYQTLAGVSKIEAHEWVQKWNRKDKQARLKVESLFLNEVSLKEIFESSLGYFMNEPKAAAKLVLKNCF